jgi:putative membrane protein insertion efficiency factor
MTMARNAVLLLLRGYKWAVSPLLPPSCRYVPTCSEYAMEAVERYGALRGGWMAMARLLRCHPFAKGGYDPVVRTAGSHACPGNHRSPQISLWVGASATKAARRRWLDTSLKGIRR